MSPSEDKLSSQTTSEDPSKRRRKKRRRLFLALLIVLFAPYLFTRVAAVFRVVRTVEMEQVPATEMGPSGSYRLLCYNIAHGRGLADSNWRDWSLSNEPKRNRIEKIGTFLAEANADVVVLNEVDFYSTWSGHQNQARAIASTAGYRYVVEQRNLDFGWIIGGCQFGNAILSRYPVVKTKVLDYPAEKEWESWLVGQKRGVVATLKLPSNQLVDVAAIHLEHRRESTRIGSAKILLELAGRPDANPLILAGDFNSTPTDYPFARFDPQGGNAMDLLFSSHEWQATNREAPLAFTFRADKPAQVIDWILVTGPHHRLEDYEVAEDLSSFTFDLSDHLPVSATIAIKE